MRISNIEPENKTDSLRDEIDRVFRDVFETQAFWNAKTVMLRNSENLTNPIRTSLNKNTNVKRKTVSVTWSVK